MQPLEIIRAAIKAVPAVKYALGVAGIIAVVAIVYSFGLGLWVAFFGALVVMILMVVLVIFAKMTTTAPRFFLMPVMVLTWAFLLLTIAAAVLLFTSVFFKKPLDFTPYLPLSPNPHINKTSNLDETNVPVAGTNSSSQILELLSTAQLQQDSGDYSDAWKSLTSAANLAGGSELAQTRRLQLAELWLRNVTTTGDEKFSPVVDQVSDVIALGAISTNKTTAADALAHLGFANFLKYRDGVAGLKIQELYEQAIKLDPDNVYANTMLAQWICLQDGSTNDVFNHFNAALQSGRDRNFVREVELDILQHEEFNQQLLLVLNDMRKNGETLTKHQAGDVDWRIYTASQPQVEQMLVESTAFISASDHLATYRWLIEKEAVTTLFIPQLFIIARLTEMSGDTKGALAQYQAIKSRSDFEQNDYEDHDNILKGIARCKSAKGSQ